MKILLLHKAHRGIAVWVIIVRILLCEFSKYCESNAAFQQIRFLHSCVLKVIKFELYLLTKVLYLLGISELTICATQKLVSLHGVNNFQLSVECCLAFHVSTKIFSENFILLLLY